MILLEWLRAKGLTQDVFAEQIGVTQSAISRYCGGERPNSNVLKSIIDATKGAVTANDFDPLPVKTPRRRGKVAP